MMEDGIGRSLRAPKRRLFERGELTFHAASGTVADSIPTGGLFVTRAPVVVYPVQSRVIGHLVDEGRCIPCREVHRSFQELACFAKGIAGRFWLDCRQGRSKVTLG